jgi:hypothetical protein
MWSLPRDLFNKVDDGGRILIETSKKYLFRLAADPNRRARLENTELASIQLIATVMISVGAVLVSVGYGFTLGEASDFPRIFSNTTATTEMQLEATLIQYAGLLSYAGLFLILGGTVVGVYGISNVRRRILREDNAPQDPTSRFRRIRHLQWWYRYDILR